MPLNIPPPPTAFFNRGRGAHEGRENKKNVGEGDFGLRYYPLGIGQGQRGVVPVEPLTAGRGQRPPMIPPSPSVQKPPMIPVQKPPMIPPQNPAQQTQAASPAAAAEQFTRVNSNLPDGVRYEPLDEETMKILRTAQAQRAAGAQVNAEAPAEPPPPTAE